MRGLVASLVCVAALVACGGKVVIDQPSGSSGVGGAGGNSASSGMPTTGTGGSLCDQAIAHFKSCSSGASTGSGPPPSCTGSIECQALCIIKSPCSAFTGSDVGATMKLANCAESCGHAP